MLKFFKKIPKEAVPLPIYTDIHCHIVPGVDDGSPDVSHLNGIAYPNAELGS